MSELKELNRDLLDIEGIHARLLKAQETVNGILLGKDQKGRLSLRDLLKFLCGQHVLASFRNRVGQVVEQIHLLLRQAILVGVLEIVGWVGEL